MSRKNTVIIIPARMASSRFPNKPLCKIAGVSMIERVYRLAKASKLASEIYIATDSSELEKKVHDFGAKVIMTSELCKTGTDRASQAMEILEETEGKHYDVVFNLQGDAVLTPPWVIDAVIDAMLQNPDIHMATPAVHLTGKALEDFIASKQKGSSTGTTVVFDKNHMALYFSKTIIPFNRDKERAPLIYRHIGLYAYRPTILRQYASLPTGTFEQVEQLEQLRALENGLGIKVVEVDYRGRTHGSVDKPEDVAVVEALIQTEGELV